MQDHTNSSKVVRINNVGSELKKAHIKNNI
jgi:hypothetical protein